ncbi:GNAT family N-acetyltransferase [Pseudoalteromonas sp. OANN1]|uniref:GNAT family N-acetyltransferase n=1 Tax=Pseudoalteromonas sp. OANN1 TaxID=2954497 RepID=UPI0020984608|nr:GNAT family N-acetyltransferase [Pseudoalteromonas sp. OANN1]MCO7201237.1 GNAT family N-acetyltransferase [Pseudoalteromonas sp. OANN1]
MQLETERLSIRRMTMDDLDAVYSHRKNPNTSKYIGAPATLESAKERLIQACQPWKGAVDERLILAIVNKQKGKLIGELVFKYVDEEKKVGEIGFRLAEDEIGCGYGYEAAAALIEAAFQQCSVDTIQAICAVENLQSQRLMLKLGMKRKNRLKAFLDIGGEKHDIYVYQLNSQSC